MLAIAADPDLPCLPRLPCRPRHAQPSVLSSGSLLKRPPKPRAPPRSSCCLVFSSPPPQARLDRLCLQTTQHGLVSRAEASCGLEGRCNRWSPAGVECGRRAGVGRHFRALRFLLVVRGHEKQQTGDDVGPHSNIRCFPFSKIRHGVGLLYWRWRLTEPELCWLESGHSPSFAAPPGS